MKYTHKVFIMSVLFFLLVANGIPASTGSSQSTPEEIRLAATHQLSTWLEKIPSGQEIYYGFTNRDEFADAVIGTPVRTFYFADEMEGASAHASELMIPAYDWRVPVVVRNEYRALVTVAPVDGSWKIVDIGAARLARELGMHQSGHANILLRSFRAKCDFLVISSGDLTAKSVMLMPLQSARRNITQLDHAAKDLFTMDEIRGMLLFPENKPGVTR